MSLYKATLNAARITNMSIESYALNNNSDVLRLIERIRQCLREREITKEHQQPPRKIYSIIHYIEHLKRCINDNPLIGRALLRFYNTIKSFSSQNNLFSSMSIVENNQSKTSFEEKISMDNLYRITEDVEPSKTSLTMSQSTKSMQPSSITRQTSGLMTKTTFNAINKNPRQRTKSDIEVLEHLLNRCESLRHLPTDVRRYTARSLLLLTYPSNTLLTRQNSPPLLVYILVYGQCQLLLETDQTTIVGQQLNIGDVYGDDSFQLIIDHRLNGLMTNETNHCNLIGFFLRDVRAYENYLSDMMKQSLLEQLRLQSTFLVIQWRTDIFDYFFKWTTYKQYKTDEIIYGNESNEHQNLYFILQGQVSFVRLLNFPWMAIKYPEYYRKIRSIEKHQRTIWRFLEIFLLSDGHYFGFESTTNHSWYLTRSTVDIISIPKTRFKALGSFAPMIFEKLRQDFLDIHPTETFIRTSYIKYLQMNHSNEDEFSTITAKHDNHFLEKINRIPELIILSRKFELPNQCKKQNNSV